MHLPTTTTTTFLAIGGTGLGKSTFGQLLCDVPTFVNDGVLSTSSEATLYENNAFRYIDTPGFNDSEGKTDEETFRQILRLLQGHSRNGVFEIHKILWFCAENGRKTANLQKEATYIQSLVEYVEEEDSANLWKNVIIITKGTFPEEGLANGAKSAAYDAMKASMMKNNHTIVDEGEFNVDHFPCWIFDLKPGPNKFTKMKPEARAPFNVYSKEEIATALQGHVRNDSTIKIQFKEAHCTRCSEEGDPRLFIGKCHPSQEKRHKIKTEKYHPKSLDLQHNGKCIRRHWKPEDGNPSKAKKFGVTAGAVSGTVGSLGASVYAFNIAAATQRVYVLKIAAAAGGGTIAGTTAFPIVAAVGLAAVGGYCINEKLKEKHRCPYCKRGYNEEGCLEECDDCKMKWDGKGCISKYLCCDKSKEDDEEDDGCDEREHCTDCNQKAKKLITKGCKEYCQKCKEAWGTTEGCDPSANHIIIIE